MNKQERIDAAKAVNEVSKSVTDFISYNRHEDEPNYFSIGSLLVQRGKELCLLAGFNVQENTNPLKCAVAMDSKESAMVFLMLQNLRKQVNVPKHTNNGDLLDLLNFQTIDCAVQMRDPALQEKQLYDLMGALAFILLNWDARENDIDEAANHCLPSTHEGHQHG
jgi:hypothetical protein